MVQKGLAKDIYLNCRHQRQIKDLKEEIENLTKREDEQKRRRETAVSHDIFFFFDSLCTVIIDWLSFSTLKSSSIAAEMLEKRPVKRLKYRRLDNRVFCRLHAEM